jgi:flagellin
VGVVLSTNTASLFATKALRSVTQVSDTTVSKLASGKRINRAGDDAAGLSINEKLTSKLRGTTVAENNISDGINLIEMTNARLNVVMERVQSIRELMVEAFNGTNSGDELDAIQREINGHMFVIDKTSDPVRPDSTVWGDSVLRGLSPIDFFAKDFQVGSGDDDVINLDFSDNNDVDNAVDLSNFRPNAVGGIFFGASAGTRFELLQIGAPTVPSHFGNSFVKAVNLDDMDIVVKNLTRMISVTDKYHARFTAAYDKLQEEKYSYSAYQSHVQDTDYAEATSKYAQDQIRQQSAASILTQANSQTGFALSLLP